MCILEERMIMIKIHLLDGSHVNKEVRYIPGHAVIDGIIDYNLTEHGRITSWNDVNIFVDYGNNCGRGVATSPEDIEFVRDELRSEHGAIPRDERDKQL